MQQPTDEVRGERKVSAKRYTPAIVSVQSVGGRPAGEYGWTENPTTATQKSQAIALPGWGRTTKSSYGRTRFDNQHAVA